MKKNKDCKLVQDLLPSYIDNLTSEETNQFIEEHIQGCLQCTQVLKDMKADVKLDKINQDKEINYLKKLKKRNLIILIVFIVIVTIFSVIIFKFYKDTAIYPYDKEGKFNYQEVYETFSEWITGKNNIIKPEIVSNFILANEVDSEENFVMIFSFDKNEKCVGVRYSKKIPSEERLKQEYETIRKIEENNTAITNARIEANQLIYSYNRWNGKTKAEILKELAEYDSSYIKIDL